MKRSCKNCGRSKPIQQFGTRNRNGKRLILGECKSCHNAKQQAKRKATSCGNGKLGGHVMVDGHVYLYQVKAPFVASGKSVMGALEYDQPRDLVRCHECGDWSKSVGIHSARVHKLHARDYKIKHGLKITSSLIAEGLRKNRAEYCVANNTLVRLRSKPKGESQTPYSRKKPMEFYNRRTLCPAQLLDKLERLKQTLGRRPSFSELQQHGISLSSAKYHFGSVLNLMAAAGLPKENRNDNMIKYGEEQLLEFLRMFYRNHGHPPTSSDFGRRFLPSKPTYVRRFGSIQAAWKRTGLPDWKLCATPWQKIHIGKLAPPARSQLSAKGFLDNEPSFLHYRNRRSTRLALKEFAAKQ